MSSSPASSSRLTSGKPTSAARRSVAGELGTQRRPRSPRCASAGNKYAAVDPVPRPTRMPSSTSAADATAAARF
jgi:hypothetical protein